MSNIVARPSPDGHVFPDVADMAAWDALSPAEQLAQLEREEAAAFASGEAGVETLEQRLARVRAR